MSNLLSLKANFQAARGLTRRFFTKKVLFLILLWLVGYFSLLFMGRSEEIVLHFPKDVVAQIEWSSGEQWAPLLSGQNSEKTNWKFTIGRYATVKTIRVRIPSSSSSNSSPPIVTLPWPNQKELAVEWQQQAPGIWESDFSQLQRVAERSYTQMLWLLLGLSLFFVPISIGICRVKSRPEGLLFFFTLLLWALFGFLLENGIPNPYNPFAGLQRYANQLAFPIDGYFASIIGIALAEVKPSFVPPLLLNSLVALLGSYFFLGEIDWKKRNSLLVILAYLLPFPVIFISLFSLEKSITSALFMFFFLLHSWNCLRRKTPLTAPELCWFLFLGLFAALFKQENVVTIFLVLFFLWFRTKQWKAVALFVMVFFAFKFSFEPKLQEASPPSWKNQYLAMNILPTISSYYFQAGDQALDANTKILWSKVFDFSAIESFFSKYYIDNTKAPPNEVDDATWSAVVKSFLLFSIQNPTLLIRSRFQISLCGGYPEIPNIYYEEKIQAKGLLEMGLKNSEKIGQLIKVYRWVKNNLSFSIWVFPLLVLTIFWPFSISFLLTLTLIPHFGIVFLFVPSCMGFYWLTMYFWASACLFLAIYEFTERRK